MSTIILHRLATTLAVAAAAVSTALASGQTVRESHPRILLDSTTKAALIAKKDANDPSWTALKTKADKLKGYPIEQYKYATRYNWYSYRIFYGFQGTGWYESVMPLGLAYQMTGDTAYSNKLIALADEILRAEEDPANQPPTGMSPMRVNLSYASRYVCPTIAVIYDWCHDRLDSTRKSKMISVMNVYFDSLRSTYNYQSYENNGPAVGNFFGGHLFAVAHMGYATYGDNPRAQQMIDWARIRFDGTPSSLLTTKDIPTNNRVAAFEGPYPSYFERVTGTPAKGAPFRGGFNFQGWAYGPNEFNRMIDYMVMVKSATGEDLVETYKHWYTGVFRSLKHALFPNRIVIDPVGDWGGNQGSVISRSLPARIAYLLGNTADSAAVQHFVYTEIPQNPNYGYHAKDVQIYALPEWEQFFFKNPARVSTPGEFPLFYAPFAPAYPKGAPGNGAIARFIWRSDWDTTATWMCAEMGASFYGDHQMHHAGHLYINRGRDQLLISPSNWRGAAPGLGVIGNGVGYVVHSSLKNTLFFDDYGDYQRTSVDQHGGQSNSGVDRLIAAEANDAGTYVRSDLTTAYNNFAWPRTVADTVNRKLERFYRSVLYIRSANLTLIYDQVKAKNSTNSRGHYEKHLRWHFPTQPTITGATAKVQHGASKMYLQTLLPATPSITTVGLASNPDNRWGANFVYAFNSASWRIEVRDQANPLELPFLTVIQTGDTTMAQMASETIRSTDSSMIGARILAGGAAHYALFNNLPGQAPVEITSVVYPLADNGASAHTLCGMVPNAAYTVSANNGTLTVTRDDSGAYTASAAGVLRFELGAANTAPKTSATLSRISPKNTGAIRVYPNPATENVEFRYTLRESSDRVRLTVHDALGAVVATAIDEPGTAGEHTVKLDLNTLTPGGLPSGVYRCRLETEGETTSTQFVIVR